MLGKLMAFVATSDAARSLAFYRDVLGLALVADEEHAIVFDSRGTMLRIQKAHAVTPAPYTALGWHVDDVRAAIAGLRERGVVFERFAHFAQDSDGVWTAPDGTKIAWFKDPDGNLLSLTQFA
jgi:catechol 2,3-dioxygenase-like lactoylglutathione lyase family enzyme